LFNAVAVVLLAESTDQIVGTIDEKQRVVRGSLLI